MVEEQITPATHVLSAVYLCVDCRFSFLFAHQCTDPAVPLCHLVTQGISENKCHASHVQEFLLAFRHYGRTKAQAHALVCAIIRRCCPCWQLRPGAHVKKTCCLLKKEFSSFVEYRRGTLHKCAAEKPHRGPA